MSGVAVPVGAAQEAAALAALPSSEKWWNPATNQVESMRTSSAWQSTGATSSAEHEVLKARIEQAAQKAREGFMQREGYDRLGGVQEEFNPADFETAPSTPMRAGPGLAVSPSTAAIGTAMGLGLVAGATGLALAKEEPFRSKDVRPGPIPGPLPSDPVPKTPIPEPSPSPFPSPVWTQPTGGGAVEEFVHYSQPQVGVASPQAWDRRRGRRKSRFRKFL